MKYPNIEAERARHGLRKNELSDAVGISRVTYDNWQSGNNKPSVDKLLKMSELFGVTIDYLIKEGGE